MTSNRVLIKGCGFLAEFMRFKHQIGNFSAFFNKEKVLLFQNKKEHAKLILSHAKVFVPIDNHLQAMVVH